MRRALLEAGLVVLVVATVASGARPGPAPIVVSGSGSEPVRVTQGDKTRVVDPDDARGRVTTRAPSSDDSAFEVPEDEYYEDEYYEEDDLPQEVEYGGEPEDRGGFESSSTLNERLPGSSEHQFARGYAPSSSLNERMAAQAATQMNAWPAADLTDPNLAEQWRQRGSESRGGN